MITTVTNIEGLKRGSPLKLVVLPAILAIATLAVYVAFLSIQCDLNGVTEVMAIERGHAIDLFLPRRLLYRPLGYLLCELLRLGGYSGSVIVPLQILSATFGALNVSVLFLILRRLTGREGIGLLLSGGYAFSYGHWVHSEDVQYITLAAFFILLSFLLLISVSSLGGKRTSGYLLLLALSSALAIFFWQTNIFFVPVVTLGLLQGRSVERSRWSDAFRYLLFLSVILGGVYLGVGYLVGGCRSWRDFIAWLTTYPRALPIWGAFDLSRMRSMVVSFVATFIPLNKGLGLRRLLQGEPSFEKLIPQMSLGVLLLSFLLWGIWAINNRRKLWALYSDLLSLCIIWFTLYALFNTWWDPYEVKWWIIPTVPVWIVLALILTEFTAHSNKWMGRIAIIFALMTIVLMALSNFTANVLPYHSVPNEGLEKAGLFGAYMQPEDLLVSADWGWAGYVPYLAGRSILDLIDVSATGREPLRALDVAIVERRQQGGRVFLVDVYSYSEGRWSWLAYNTGLKLEDFDRYKRRVAWEYQSEIVWEILE